MGNKKILKLKKLKTRPIEKKIAYSPQRYSRIIVSWAHVRRRGVNMT